MLETLIFPRPTLDLCTSQNIHPDSGDPDHALDVIILGQYQAKNRMQSARIMSLPIRHRKSDTQPRPSPWAPPLRAWRVGARPDEGQVSNLTSSHKNTIHEKQSKYLDFSWFHTTKVRLGEFSCFIFFGNLPRTIGLGVGVCKAGGRG